MKTKQLTDLGISKEVAKKVQELHGKDRQRLLNKIATQEEPEMHETIRASIRLMLPIIRRTRSLMEVHDLCVKLWKEDMKHREEAIMAYYKKCENCGAYLDPEEVCDCKKETAAEPATTNPENTAAANAPDHTEA